MSKTKQKILDAALKLFNELGYQQVTIRMIALELQMSSGNLNYHFKKREDIIEALYFQMVKDFDERVDTLPQTKISFPQIHHDMHTSMQRMVRYKFIWTDLYSLLNSNAKIFDHFSKAHQRRTHGCAFLFNHLIQEGFMRRASFTGEYDMLAERMINFGDTWLYTTAVYQRQPTEAYILKQSKALLGTLYPYLTQKGMHAYEAVNT